MNASFSGKLASLILLAGIGIASFTAVGVVFGNPAGGDRMPARSAGPVPAAPAACTPGGDCFLALDAAVNVGGALLVYRGLHEDGRIRIDVVIPDLDPERAYVHMLDVPSARKGFRLLGRGYRLEAVNRHRLRIASGGDRLG